MKGKKGKKGGKGEKSELLVKEEGGEEKKGDKGKMEKKGGKGEKAENLLVKEEGADEEVSPDEKKLREKVEKHCKEAADEMACGEEVDKRGEEL